MSKKITLLVAVCGATVGLLLTVAPVASAVSVAPKTYCGNGATYTTSDPYWQDFLDGAIALSGGLYVLENGYPTPNEPDENTLDKLLPISSDGDDDLGLQTRPDGVDPAFVFFLPVSPGPCAPPSPMPGASHVLLCNTAWPSDTWMLSAAVSPEGRPEASGPGPDNPAADAVKSGDWYYPNLISAGGKLRLSCFVPAGAKDTGKVVDEQGNGYDKATVAGLHAGGWARTVVYEEYTA